METVQQLFLARRVIGMASAGVFASQQALSQAREGLADAAKQGIDVTQGDHVLQRMQLSVLPDRNLCQEGLAQVNSAYWGLVSHERDAQGFERPRAR